MGFNWTSAIQLAQCAVHHSFPICRRGQHSPVVLYTVSSCADLQLPLHSQYVTLAWKLCTIHSSAHVNYITSSCAFLWAMLWQASCRRCSSALRALFSSLSSWTRSVSSSHSACIEKKKRREEQQHCQRSVEPRATACQGSMEASQRKSRAHEAETSRREANHMGSLSLKRAAEDAHTRRKSAQGPSYPGTPMMSPHLLAKPGPACRLPVGLLPSLPLHFSLVLGAPWGQTPQGQTTLGQLRRMAKLHLSMCGSKPHSSPLLFSAPSSRPCCGPQRMETGRRLGSRCNEGPGTGRGGRRQR